MIEQSNLESDNQNGRRRIRHLPLHELPNLGVRETGSRSELQVSCSHSRTTCTIKIAARTKALGDAYRIMLVLAHRPDIAAEIFYAEISPPAGGAGRNAAARWVISMPEEKQPAEMRLPPVDQYLQPFMQPLGALAYWAAQLDQKVIEACACTLASGVEVDHLDFSLCGAPSAMEAAATNLRNWNRSYIDDRIAEAAPNLIAQAKDIFDRIEAIRSRRHNAIHGVLEVGIFDRDDGCCEVRALQVGFPRRSKQPSQISIGSVTPATIGKIATELYEACGELGNLIYSVQAARRSLPPSGLFLDREAIASLSDDAP